MIDIISLLPDSVANKIAAGEVVQRPASACKELMENAIDAGAGTVTLNIKDAGRTLIQVTDNGSGMSPTDARMCFERHATSKIHSAEDLFEIRTFGFRGEAMASIAAISQVEMLTRRKEDELGTRIIIEGAAFKEQSLCNCQTGTSVSVKNLFYNVPARRNFLKSDNVELRHIYDEFHRVALAYPSIGFNLIINGKTVYQLSAANLKQRIVGIFGNQLQQRLLAVDHSIDFVSITGFVGKAEFAKKVRGEQFFFVNGRYIRHPYFHYAVEDAYGSLIQKETFPSYFLFFNVDTKNIDINIHPTKTEVKFVDERMIYEVLRATVKKAIGQFAVSPTLNFDVEGLFPNSPFSPGNQGQAGQQSSFSGHHQTPAHNQPFAFPSHEKRGNRDWEKIYEVIRREPVQENKPEIIVSGMDSDNQSVEISESRQNVIQLRKQFIITTVKSGLMIIDQQRAHERILYERFLSSVNQQNGLSQQQLFPIQETFSPSDAALVLEILDDLFGFGFTIEPQVANDHSFVITGLPQGIVAGNFRPLIESILENYRTDKSIAGSERDAIIAKSMAKNASIKYGKALHPEEMIALVNDLFSTSIPELSPDGKTVLTILSFEEVLKYFSSQP